MNSRAVKRIDDVTRLRTAQYAEDSGAAGLPAGRSLHSRWSLTDHTVTELRARRRDGAPESA